MVEASYYLAQPQQFSMHDFYFNFATNVPVIIASVDYRLALEHRLPAAYDGAVEALHWIKTSQDDCLRDYADLSNCFLLRDYVWLLRAMTFVHSLKIGGLILIQQLFGGSRRTSSELRLVNDPILGISVCDLMWDLSLPLGVDRDHEYRNPMAGGDSNVFDKVKALGWRVLVSGSDGDPLIDVRLS
ncbi:putative carboxylesterase [Rosa chinensis]|uniref:Putative carboxylesterase n=1 Tax=Rosa chinensis TaxID=74649 RepID=A0A2P6SMT8_ROSCH|nr:putative carboxylesterase [Rosa chinensis]